MFLTRIETLPFQNLRQNRTLLNAQKIANNLKKKLDRKEKGWKCLSQDCAELFKTRKAQQLHTETCLYWKNFSTLRLRAISKVQNYTENKEKIKRAKARADKIRILKGRKTSFKFKCPGINCTFQVSSWYTPVNKKKILNHLSHCKIITEDQYIKLIFTHNLFKK